ncbi:Eisosome component PIL1-domain-containing protein [Chytridium lagenaria]|nr:Eisosome component PIL1-domain-containing protein [Chytridium lagenaria]
MSKLSDFNQNIRRHISMMGSDYWVVAGGHGLGISSPPRQYLASGKKDVIKELRNLAKEQGHANKFLAEWGKIEAEDLKNITEKLAFISEKMAEATNQYSNSYDRSRMYIKEIKANEDSLSVLHRKQKDLRSKLDNAQKKKNKDVEAFRKELGELDQEVLAREAFHEGFKRERLKAAMNARWDGLMEYSAKLSVISNFGNHLANQIPQGYPTPGVEVPPFAGAQITAQILTDYEKCATNWTASVPWPFVPAVLPPLGQTPAIPSADKAAATRLSWNTKSTPDLSSSFLPQSGAVGSSNHSLGSSYVHSHGESAHPVPSSSPQASPEVAAPFETRPYNPPPVPGFQSVPYTSPHESEHYMAATIRSPDTYNGNCMARLVLRPRKAFLPHLVFSSHMGSLPSQLRTKDIRQEVQLRIPVLRHKNNAGVSKPALLPLPQSLPTRVYLILTQLKISLLPFRNLTTRSQSLRNPPTLSLPKLILQVTLQALYRLKLAPVNAYAGYAAPAAPLAVTALQPAAPGAGPAGPSLDSGNSSSKPTGGPISPHGSVSTAKLKSDARVATLTRSAPAPPSYEAAAHAVRKAVGGLGVFVVCFDWVPNQNDELALAIGDAVAASEVYEDGWAYGRVLHTGAIGFFPFNAVVPAIDGFGEPARSPPGQPTPQSLRDEGSISSDAYRIITESIASLRGPSRLPAPSQIEPAASAFNPFPNVTNPFPNLPAASFPQGLQPPTSSSSSSSGEPFHPPQ